MGSLQRAAKKRVKSIIKVQKFLQIAWNFQVTSAHFLLIFCTLSLLFSFSPTVFLKNNKTICEFNATYILQLSNCYSSFSRFLVSFLEFFSEFHDSYELYLILDRNCLFSLAFCANIRYEFPQLFFVQTSKVCCGGTFREFHRRSSP